jgi:hypothetical protein
LVGDVAAGVEEGAVGPFVVAEDLGEGVGHGVEGSPGGNGVPRESCPVAPAIKLAAVTTRV